MLQLVLYVLLALVVAVGLFLLATRFLPAGEQIAPALRDEPVWELPAERNMQPEDVDGVRLPVALRGYRFAETDLLLDRLAGELRARDAEIARLRGEPDLVSPDEVNPDAMNPDEVDLDAADHRRFAPPADAPQTDAAPVDAPQADAPPTTAPPTDALPVADPEPHERS